MVAEESAVGRQGGWVRRCQHEMAAAVDEVAFADGKAAPEHEDDVVAAFGERTYGGVGEQFPAFALM